MSDSIVLTPADSREQVAIARELFHEYSDAIGVNLEYQGFAAELEALPSPYVPPHGTLLIAQINGDTAGCVALRRLDHQTGELKRLYVRPAFRGWGLGEHLIEATIRAAHAAGYTALRLDTLPSMTTAQGLYRKLGFSEIPAYNNTHLPGTRFYELALI
ncbi:acetyltransferase (GNAT) family protein [Luteimonas cucumeris]|uniref:Acetyltransferase (GNAT) family protein n=1 Tax=Luteimonas cucumeris TaxID=985012 RepID=A0A562LE97_9GAMM|nr:GNAT family N-acetyltransferase [Luteimonas cucumeris]TWI06009.1 acetyltransferase (GNAT) family protein [Luteimonas cucumeris]